MKLARIEGGLEAFIDANIFIYHFTGVSDESSDFLIRCEEGELTGVTSLNVLLEVLHRLMMLEAVNKKLVSPPNILKKLKKSPGKIKQLQDYFFNTMKISEMGIRIKPITIETIVRSQAIRERYGLLVSDSLIVACMEEGGIRVLASNDQGFSNVKGLVVHRPTDAGVSVS